MRILVVEDEQDLRQVLKKGLLQQNYTVDEAADGQIAIKKLDLNQYDLVLLDLNLPLVDGITVCKHIRQQKMETGVIMLTARTAVDEKVTGLDIGADDYMEKPFVFKELLARIESVRRRQHNQKQTKLETKDLILDPRQKRVWLNKKELKLNRKEYSILEYLLRNKGKVVSQEELFEHVWNDEADPFTQTVKAQLNNLRRKIDIGRKARSYIETIKNQGYLINN